MPTANATPALRRIDALRVSVEVREALRGVGVILRAPLTITSRTVTLPAGLSPAAVDVATKAWAQALATCDRISRNMAPCALATDAEWTQAENDAPLARGRYALD